MSEAKRVVRNASYLYIARILTTLLSVGFSITLARELGEDGFGSYGFALSTTALLGLGLELGLDVFIIREVAREKAQASKYIGNVLALRAILGFVVYGVLVGIIALKDFSDDTTAALFIFGIAMVLSGISNVFLSTFRAFERMHYEAFLTIGRRVVFVGLGLAALWMGYGLAAVVWAAALAALLEATLGLVICRGRLAKPRIEIDLAFWKRMAKAALPLALISAAGMIMVRTDSVMLGWVKGEATVGWYMAAYNLVMALEMIPRLGVMALLPTLSVYSSTSLNSLRRSCEKAQRYLLILGLPIAVGASLLAENIISLVYPEEFENSIVVLQILSWHVFILFLRWPLQAALISMDKERQVTAITAGCALMNVVLNLLLIPSLSYRGAAFATVATGLVLMALLYVLVSRYLYRPQLHTVILKPMLACTAMIACIYFTSSLNLALVIALSAVAYFACLALVRGFTRDDVRVLREVIGGEEDEGDE
jgi:O-antigen/teichoic acid export membrane protein